MKLILFAIILLIIIANKYESLTIRNLRNPSIDSLMQNSNMIYYKHNIRNLNNTYDYLLVNKTSETNSTDASDTVSDQTTETTNSTVPASQCGSSCKKCEYVIYPTGIKELVCRYTSDDITSNLLLFVLIGIGVTASFVAVLIYLRRKKSIHNVLSHYAYDKRGEKMRESNNALTKKKTINSNSVINSTTNNKNTFNIKEEIEQSKGYKDVVNILSGKINKKETNKSVNFNLENKNFEDNEYTPNNIISNFNNYSEYDVNETKLCLNNNFDANINAKLNKVECICNKNITSSKLVLKSNAINPKCLKCNLKTKTIEKDESVFGKSMNDSINNLFNQNSRNLNSGIDKKTQNSYDNNEYLMKSIPFLNKLTHLNSNYDNLVASGQNSVNIRNEKSSFANLSISNNIDIYANKTSILLNNNNQGFKGKKNLGNGLKKIINFSPIKNKTDKRQTQEFYRNENLILNINKTSDINSNISPTELKSNYSNFSKFSNINIMSQDNSDFRLRKLTNTNEIFEKSVFHSPTKSLNSGINNKNNLNSAVNWSGKLNTDNLNLNRLTPNKSRKVRFSLEKISPDNTKKHTSDYYFVDSIKEENTMIEENVLTHIDKRKYTDFTAKVPSTFKQQILNSPLSENLYSLKREKEVDLFSADDNRSFESKDQNEDDIIDRNNYIINVDEKDGNNTFINKDKSFVSNDEQTNYKSNNYLTSGLPSPINNNNKTMITHNDRELRKSLRNSKSIRHIQQIKELKRKDKVDATSKEIKNNKKRRALSTNPNKLNSPTPNKNTNNLTLNTSNIQITNNDNIKNRYAKGYKINEMKELYMQQLREEYLKREQNEDKQDINNKYQLIPHHKTFKDNFVENVLRISDINATGEVKKEIKYKEDVVPGIVFKDLERERRIESIEKSKKWKNNIPSSFDNTVGKYIINSDNKNNEYFGKNIAILKNKKLGKTIEENNNNNRKDTQVNKNQLRSKLFYSP